ncbi:MAG: hypothetical protein K6A45_11005 [Lachnospiraceae bacterium]|nr:hypothetical protein [Lachnospiraceae bacterium]
MKKNRLNKILGVLLAVALSLSGGFFTGLEMNVTVQAEAATQKISAKKKTVEAGKTFKLKIKNAKGKYTWESSNSKVAKVKTKSGKSVKIVAVKAGKATITAKRGSTKFKCTVTVKEKQGSGSTVTATPTPTAEPTPEVIMEHSVSSDSSTVLNIAVGKSMQLKFPAKEVRRFYVHDEDKQYVDVTEDGLVTAKAGEGRTVTIHIESKDYNNYHCKVNILKSGSKVENPTPQPTVQPTSVVTTVPTYVPVPTATTVPTYVPVPTVTSAPTYVPEPTATPAPTVTEAPTTTPAPTVTEVPTATPEPSGKGDLNGERYDPAKLSATVSLGSTYGLLSPHTREAYQKHLEYSIEDERGFIKACRDALEHGAESFTITFRGYDCDHWWNIFCEKLNNQSELSGYTANGYTASLDDRNHKITIRPQYKDAWKAIIYLRYDGYETDDDIKKLLNAAISLAQEAIDAKGNNAYDVLLYVNNRICSMTTYSSPIPTEHDCPQRDATGVFYCGDGVCESYTAAMRMILNVLGLENDTIVNKKGSHIWNRVLLDGTWYHIDVTWNDVEKLGGGFYNSYFMLTETELLSKNSSSKDPLAHSWYNLYYR